MTTSAPQPPTAAALDKLHDFYQPVPVSWSPQTVGWYVVSGIGALLLLWFVVREVRLWVRNRYRREALSELASTSPEQLSALLKRTALAGWPREQVASLSGDRWLRFLVESSAIHSFQEAPGNLIEAVALAPASLTAEEQDRLKDLAAQWIRRHRVQT
jgi:Domain of unknown function (DUF4381)